MLVVSLTIRLRRSSGSIPELVRRHGRACAADTDRAARAPRCSSSLHCRTRPVRARPAVGVRRQGWRAGSQNRILALRRLIGSLTQNPDQLWGARIAAPHSPRQIDCRSRRPRVAALSTARRSPSGTCGSPRPARRAPPRPPCRRNGPPEVCDRKTCAFAHNCGGDALRPSPLSQKRILDRNTPPLEVS